MVEIRRVTNHHDAGIANSHHCGKFSQWERLRAPVPRITRKSDLIVCNTIPNHSVDAIPIANDAAVRPALAALRKKPEYQALVKQEEQAQAKIDQARLGQ